MNPEHIPTELNSQEVHLHAALPHLFGQLDGLREVLVNIINRLPRVREFQGLNPDELIENEIRFQSRLRAALQDWNERGLSYVLWDKDETLGDYRHVGNQIGWFFRPGIIELLKNAVADFPNIKHGILSHRSEQFMVESFEPGGQFYELRNVFDLKRIYSSRGYEFYSDEELFARSGVAILQCEDRNSYLKFVRLRELQKSEPETVFRPVDDLPYVEMLGRDALYVGDLKPQKIIRVLALGCALETGEYPYLRCIERSL